MDDIWTLLLLSTAMLVGCYLAGIIPLAINFSEDKLKLVTVLGAGLLVGTALAVIIPEGIHAMSMATAEDQHEHKHEVQEKDVAAKPGTKGETESSHEHVHSMIDDHSLIGITLVSGFIFMLLVDQIGGAGHIHAPSDTDLPTTNSSQNRHKITATLGLVVHAAVSTNDFTCIHFASPVALIQADGIAMGAAVSMSTAHLTLIVFVAIMLHKFQPMTLLAYILLHQSLLSKAPAAFGLVSFLLHEGFDRTRIRRHLFVFAAAAPIGAILTYLCINQKSMASLNDNHTTGIAMLFSAGTFLYVATVHVLPEIASRQTRQTLQDGTVVIHEHKGFTKLDLVALVFGAIVPVILSIGHKH